MTSVNPHWQSSPVSAAHPVSARNDASFSSFLHRASRSALAIVALAAAALACGGSMKPVDACIEVTASPSVNLYDGQAHAITLYFYPLSSPTGFEQEAIDDLVKVTGVEGATGPTISVTLGPGEVQELREAFPTRTAYVGIVADYYQEGVETPGKRRALVPAKCSMFGSPKITLTARELLVD